MAFTLQWADHGVGPETIETVQLPVGHLIVTRQADVITDIAWDQQDLLTEQNAVAKPKGKTTFISPRSLPKGEGTEECSNINPVVYIHPWLDPQANVTLTLLKQGTPFRNLVWAELCKIPYGATLTYAGLAKNINSSARAVGNACRDNPYPLVIPCHRVVAASGMGGYCGQTTGNFMNIKTRLLAFESAHQSGK